MNADTYDILAQPYPGTEGLKPRALHLARFYERVGETAHKLDPDLLIVVPDQFNNSTKQFALARRPRILGAVYSFEYYAPNWNPRGKHRLALYENRAHEWNYPTWVLEFTAFNCPCGGLTTSPDPHWRSDTRNFLQAARSDNVGWTIHRFSYFENRTLLRLLRNGL